MDGKNSPLLSFIPFYVVYLHIFTYYLLPYSPLFVEYVDVAGTIQPAIGTPSSPNGELCGIACHQARRIPGANFSS